MLKHFLFYLFIFILYYIIIFIIICVFKCVCEVSTVHISLSPPDSLSSAVVTLFPPLLRCRGLPTLTFLTVRRASTALPRCHTTTLPLSFLLLTHIHQHYPTALGGLMCVHGAQTLLLSALLGLTVVARQQCFQWFAVFLLHSLVDMSKSLEKSWLFLGSVSLFGFTAKCLRALHVKFAHVMYYISFSF